MLSGTIMWLINLKGAPSAPIIEDASKIAQYSVMAGTSTHKKQVKKRALHRTS